MDTTAGLIIFGVVGAWLCARHRAAVPALFFGVTAVVLFCTTPLGSGVPGALGTVVHGVSTVGGQVANAGHISDSR
jgi:membrane associated rhomboid family serine protease